MRNTSRTLRPWFGRPTTRISSPAATEPSERIRRYAPGRNASVKRRTKPISSIRTPSRQPGHAGFGDLEQRGPDLPALADERPVHVDPLRGQVSPNCATGKRSAELALPPPQIFGSHRRRWPCRRLRAPSGQPDRRPRDSRLGRQPDRRRALRTWRPLNSKVRGLPTLTESTRPSELAISPSFPPRGNPAARASHIRTARPRHHGP